MVKLTFNEANELQARAVQDCGQTMELLNHANDLKKELMGLRDELENQSDEEKQNDFDELASELKEYLEIIVRAGDMPEAEAQSTLAELGIAAEE